MSSTHALVSILKAELKAAGITYAQLARSLDLAESTVKRMFAQGEMPLSRVDQVCTVLGTDFSALARRLALAHAPRGQLSEAQEAAVVADPRLLLVAICALSQWTLEQIVATYALSEAEVVARLLRLDQLGLIELRPHNRYKLLMSKTLRWRPDGPVMRFFRQRVVGDYFSAGFDGDGELLMLVHGQTAPQHAARFNERLQRVAEDFAQQHLADQALPADQKRPYTLVLGMRSWLFAAFRDLKRDPDGPTVGQPVRRRATAGSDRAGRAGTSGEAGGRPRGRGQPDQPSS